MSDQEFQDPSLQSDDENKLTSDQFEAFREALEILYIKGNASGRRRFYEEWSQATPVLFDPELVRMDHEGTEDRKKKNALEDKAIEKQSELLQTLENVEKKSVHEGLLQKDYVRGLVEGFGWHLSLLIYSEKIVRRFLSPPPEEEVQKEKKAQPSALSQARAGESLSDAALQEAMQQPKAVQGNVAGRPDLLSTAGPRQVTDDMDDVQPIEMQAPQQQPPAPAAAPLPSTLSAPEHQQIQQPEQNVPEVPPLAPPQPSRPQSQQNVQQPQPTQFSPQQQSVSPPSPASQASEQKPPPQPAQPQESEQNMQSPQQEQKPVQKPPRPSLSLGALSGGGGIAPIPKQAQNEAPSDPSESTIQKEDAQAEENPPKKPKPKLSLGALSGVPPKPSESEGGNETGS